MPAPPLIGDHQKLNAALALAVVEALQSKIPASDSAIRTGLETVTGWGGCNWSRARPDKKFCWTARTMWPEQRFCAKRWRIIRRNEATLVLGVLQDKDWRQICEILAPLASRIFTVPVSSERSANPNQLAAACRAANLSAEISVCDSLRGALEKIQIMTRCHYRLALSGRRSVGMLGLFQ